VAKATIAHLNRGERMKQLLLVILSVTSLTAFADGVHTHLGTVDQQKAAFDWNQKQIGPHASPPASWSVVRPFSEVENTGYVAISSASDYEMPQLRLAIAQNLPTSAALIIYVGDASEVPALKAQYSQYLDADHLKFLVVPEGGDADPLWARDSLPFPVYMQSGFGLVDSIYPQDFEPDAQFAAAFNIPMVSTGQEFRGGNLLFDLAGNCFSEDTNETAGLSNPQQYFTQYYGCKTVTLLDQQGGIGDIDERIKFLSNTDAVTDNPTYATLLQGKGYTVHMIPTTGADDETYMNTLLVNGTIFVPQMGIPTDQSAVTAYQNLGFKAIGVITKELATKEDGNIHCLTMNYPPGSFTSSVRGPDFVEFKR
jgi:hypothetical protein